MTQSLPASVSLEAQSTELPIAWDVMPAGDAQIIAMPGSPLVLFPGKPGQVRLRSRNNGDQSVQLSLAVKGNFPTDWLVTSGESAEIIWSRTVAPKDEVNEILIFEIPSDFFEHSQALTQQDTLELQYQSELHLYASRLGDSERQLAGYQVVNLYVRPHTAYTHFLPEIYQRSDFVSRFLTIFEQAFDPTVQVLDDFWAYLDPLTAPKALIPFLAEWVAWPLNPNWTLKQQRWLIRHAIELYQWRGTSYGLQLALSLVTGLPNDEDHIRIQEESQADFVIGDVFLQDEPMLGGGRSFHFWVQLRSDSPATAEHIRGQETVVRAIIEQEKPAFCTYNLEFLE